MEKTWEQLSKADFLKIKDTRNDYDSKYSELYIFNTKIKHDSGFNAYAIFGLSTSSKEIVKIGFLDDLQIEKIEKEIRIDCSMKGIFRFWSNDYNFYFSGFLTSSSTLKVILREKQ